MKRTNIMYLTSSCNLDCVYCYEKPQRDKLENPINLSKEEATDFLEEIAAREVGSSVVVIFGGEPTLRFDLIEHIIEEAIRIGHRYCFTMPSNGVLFADSKFMQKFMAFYYTKIVPNQIIFNIEISWDGQGHFRRTYPNHESSQLHVENALDRFQVIEQPITIRYTIHAFNSHHKEVIFDTVYALERWKNIVKIQYSYAHEELDHMYEPQNSSEVKANLNPYFETIFKKYGIPLCHEVCELCGKCTFQKNDDVNNYRIPGTPGIVTSSKTKQGTFNHFEK